MIQYLNVKEIERERERVGRGGVCLWVHELHTGLYVSWGGGVTCTDVAPISSIFYSLRYSISLLSTTCSRLASL